MIRRISEINPLHVNLNPTPAEMRAIQENSLERVLNNALWIAQRGTGARNEILSERCGILVNDLINGTVPLLPLATRVWDATRAAIIRRELATMLVTKQEQQEDKAK